MRNHADLEAALIAMADDAEDERRVAVAQPRRSRRQLVAVAAAVIVASLVVTGVVLFGTRSRTPAATERGDLPLRSMVFAWPSSPRFKVLNATLDPGAQYWIVQVDGHQYDLSVQTIAHLRESRYPYPNTDPATAQHVDIRGVTGYLGCAGHSSDPPWCAPGSLDLAWQPHGSSWVETGANDTPADRSRILWLARHLDFNRSAPLRSPVSLIRRPDGRELVEFGLGYGRSGRPGSWSWEAIYSDVDIQVSTSPVPKARPGGRALTVDGRRAWWQPAGRDVSSGRYWIDAGDGRSIIVIADGRTLDWFERTARLVRIAPHPDAPDTWPAATRALP